MVTRRAGVLVAMLLLGAGVRTASAQTTGQVGLVMGYPGTAGVIWHATDWLAVRPEISFVGITTGTSGSRPSPSLEDSGTWRIRAGLAGLWYLVRDEPFRIYVSPRYSHEFDGRIGGSGLTGGGFGSSSESTSNGYEVSGALGAQYLIGTRFAIFAELGVESELNSATTELRTTLNGVVVSVSRETRNTRITTLRNAVGAVLYF
jgi:hypothetical protein